MHILEGAIIGGEYGHSKSYLFLLFLVNNNLNVSDASLASTVWNLVLSFYRHFCLVSFRMFVCEWFRLRLWLSCWPESSWAVLDKCAPAAATWTPPRTAAVAEGAGKACTLYPWGRSAHAAPRVSYRAPIAGSIRRCCCCCSCPQWDNSHPHAVHSCVSKPSVYQTYPNEPDSGRRRAADDLGTHCTRNTTQTDRWSSAQADASVAGYAPPYAHWYSDRSRWSGNLDTTNSPPLRRRHRTRHLYLLLFGKR